MAKSTNTSEVTNKLTDYSSFGIEKEALIKKLKFISEDTKLIDVNLIQGLDNVFLKDFTAIEVLEEVLK